MDPLETLIVNARVRTMDDARPFATCIGISGGRIVAVGDGADLDGLVGPDTRRLDLHGLTVTPGFHDSHMHVLPYGVFLGYADLSPDAGVRDARALALALRAWAERNPQSAWAFGSRYDQNAFPGARHPTRHDLDAVLPDMPAYAEHTSGHAAVANSAALRLAGITRETADPTGGTIVRDTAGEPTGVLLEAAAWLVASRAPRPAAAELTEAVLRAGRALARVGVTSASDMSLSWIGGPEAVPAYLRAVEQGYAVRTTLCPCAADVGGPDKLPGRSAFESDVGLRGHAVLRLGPMKIFADGALTTRTAALREPYVDGSGAGRLMLEPDLLASTVRAAHAAGWQVATHAIGDRAIDATLRAYAGVNGGRCSPARRHRVEHAMLLDDDLADRFAATGAVAAMQPEFLARLGDAYVLGLGEERAGRLNPYRALADRGVAVAFGSDCPVVPGRPLDGMRAAVRRRTPSGRTLGPEQALTPGEALRAYTVGAAYAAFVDGDVGRISPGYRADLVALTHDPAEPEELDQAEVVATMADGRIVYSEDVLE